jgi:hypothetical protein
MVALEGKQYALINIKSNAIYFDLQMINLCSIVPKDFYAFFLNLPTHPFLGFSSTEAIK